MNGKSVGTLVGLGAHPELVVLLLGDLVEATAVVLLTLLVITARIKWFPEGRVRRISRIVLGAASGFVGGWGLRWLLAEWWILIGLLRRN